MVTEPTRLDNTLDLFVTSNPSIVKSVNVMPWYLDHESVVTDRRLDPVFTRKATCKISKFSQVDWTKIRSKVSDFATRYFTMFSTCDVNTKWLKFKSALNNIVDDPTLVPCKMSISRSHVLWMTRLLLRSIRKKQRLHK